MKKKLKIAMFFSSDPSQAGGVQEHIFFLSEKLKDLGHQITIFGPEKNILPYKNYQPISKILQLPVPNGNWANITIESKNNKKLIEKINRQQYDIIHIHEPYIPFVNWEIIKKTQSKKIATFHSAWDNDSLVNFINPFIALFQDIFSTNFTGAIFVSKIVKKRWQDLCSKKVIQKVIYHGVDKSFFPINKKDSNIINLLFVGRIVNRKGLKYLLKAIKKITKDLSNIKLTVLGDGPMKKSLENYVTKNKLKKFVSFKGETIGQEKIKYYQNADIFCAPYFDEAFGITIIEAMACGLPIVAFKNSAFKEILKDYPYPELLVKPRDVDKLTRALEKIIEDKNMRQEISSWLLKESKKYSWKKVAKEIQEFYYKVLKI